MGEVSRAGRKLARSADQRLLTAPLQALEAWDPDRPLFACDTRPGAQPLVSVAADAQAGGVIIGPEGGLSRDEWEALDSHGFVRRVTLGPNILRAETAAMAALAVIGCANSPPQS